MSDFSTLADQLAIAETISRLGWSVDRCNWSALLDLLADTVHVDYTSLWGGQAEDLQATELVRRWEELLTGLDSTQHMITNVLSTIGEGVADATANVIAVHRRESPIGDPLWTCGGYYDVRLVRDDDRWRIRSLTLIVTWTLGNLHVLTGAPEN